MCPPSRRKVTPCSFRSPETATPQRDPPAAPLPWALASYSTRMGVQLVPSRAACGTARQAAGRGRRVPWASPHFRAPAGSQHPGAHLTELPLWDSEGPGSSRALSRGTTAQSPPPQPFLSPSQVTAMTTEGRGLVPLLPGRAGLATLPPVHRWHVARGTFTAEPPGPCPPHLPLQMREVPSAGGPTDRCRDTDRLPGKTNRGSDGNRLLLVSARLSPG